MRFNIALSQNRVKKNLACLLTVKGLVVESFRFREPVSYAQLGTTYREDLKHGGVRIKIKRTHRHPDYIPTQKYNDIGLVELERKVEFNDLIKPACLQVEEKIDSAELIATGWGANHVGGDLSPTLRKLNLTIVPYDICYQSYQPEVRLEQGLNNEQQFCANAMNGGDTCQVSTHLNHYDKITENKPVLKFLLSCFFPYE